MLDPHLNACSQRSGDNIISAASNSSNYTPLLKWAGGKRWLVPELITLWEPHQHRRLVEPFCGGLAVALGLMPQQALLNDANPHLINFYKQVQSGLQINIKMENNKELYYKHRKRLNKLIAKGTIYNKEAASIFYYLNRTGYNGLCRFNKKGYFNVPFGRYKTINYLRNFSHYVDVLQDWTFTADHFEDVRIEPDDFIYADPPYDVEFVQYSQNGFSWNDQVALVEWLSNHPGPVVLSNQATERICKLYREAGFSIKEISAPRRISRTGDRTPAREVLATKGIAS